jgi:hypothetical protein
VQYSHRKANHDELDIQRRGLAAFAPLLPRRRVLGTAMAAAWATAAVGYANPARALAPQGPPNLELNATADKSVYSPGDRVTVTVAVKNVGAGTAQNIREAAGRAAGAPPLGRRLDSRGIDGIAWLDSDVGFGSGFSLPAGRSRTLIRRGVIDDWAADHGQAAINWVFASDGTVATATNPGVVSFAVAVPGAVGEIVGTVCEGEQFDVLVFKRESPDGAPIGVPDVRVSVLNPANPNAPYATTTSDAHGNFAFQNVPVGIRSFRLETPAGWHLMSGPECRAPVVRGADPNQTRLWVAAHRD